MNCSISMIESDGLHSTLMLCNVDIPFNSHGIFSGDAKLTLNFPRPVENSRLRFSIAARVSSSLLDIMLSKSKFLICLFNNGQTRESVNLLVTAKSVSHDNSSECKLVQGSNRHERNSSTCIGLFRSTVKCFTCDKSIRSSIGVSLCRLRILRESKLGK